MRFIVLPLSLKHNIMYCQRTAPLVGGKPRLDDRIADRAAKTWDEWQKSDTKWKQSLVKWTESMLARINYNEWSLKGIPAKNRIFVEVKTMAKPQHDTRVPEGDLSSKHIESNRIEKIPVMYVSSVSTVNSVTKNFQDLASRATSHHKKYFWLSLIGAPLTLPVALIPIIPNIPGFYLLFRAWSHWKAVEGGMHLSYLLKNSRLDFVHNKPLDDFYSEKIHKLNKTDQNDDILLRGKEDVKHVLKLVDAAEMETEIYRALNQIKHAKEKQAKS